MYRKGGEGLFWVKLISHSVQLIVRTSFSGQAPGASSDHPMWFRCSGKFMDLQRKGKTMKNGGMEVDHILAGESGHTITMAARPLCRWLDQNSRTHHSFLDRTRHKPGVRGTIAGSREYSCRHGAGGPCSGRGAMTSYVGKTAPLIVSM